LSLACTSHAEACCATTRGKTSGAGTSRSLYFPWSSLDKPRSSPCLSRHTKVLPARSSRPAAASRSEFQLSLKSTCSSVGGFVGGFVGGVGGFVGGFVGALVGAVVGAFVAAFVGALVGAFVGAVAACGLLQMWPPSPSPNGQSRPQELNVAHVYFFTALSSCLQRKNIHAAFDSQWD
jgi:hypothetical protein